MIGWRDSSSQGRGRADRRLEAGYRRLLRLYPVRYRRVHEEEMLAVLMTAARRGQCRPSLGEAADLIAGAVRVRCQPRSGEPAWRRPLRLAVAATLTGMMAGIAFAALNPPQRTSTEMVLCSASLLEAGGPGDVCAQAGIATSHVVLWRAARLIGPAQSAQALRRQVQVIPITDRILSFTARAGTAAQALRTVNAVARSYIAEINLHNPGLKQKPEVLDRGTVIPGPSWLARVLAPGGTGALCGALLGAILGLATGRTPRRLRAT